ncbi:uncharacterized protein Tco025E_02584 [Trypanosoma conorhini]|uniref:Haloacid dehalogenase-like hydrolase n=1 Tax=Trypanosoma conorhini TaxID=83891 RepID=A0A3R7LC69_9TRYP|nr:uncharacterized protein Tco025E_02584 [Trypanosoma conorhini]RNF24295.1 hypothetical protein Tco025E_02584 [Trypanosoma conorhini]
MRLYLHPILSVFADLLLCGCVVCNPCFSAMVTWEVDREPRGCLTTDSGDGEVSHLVLVVVVAAAAMVVVSTRTAAGLANCLSSSCFSLWYTDFLSLLLLAFCSFLRMCACVCEARMLGAWAKEAGVLSVLRGMTVRVGVSFDLLGTLVEVYPSSGHQYAVDIRRFLSKKGVEFPPIDVEKMEEASTKCLKEELQRDRAMWEAQKLGAGKEMPIGGLTKASVFDFWGRVVDATLASDGDSYNNDEKVMAIIRQARNTPEWTEFLEDVVQRFATPEPYGWLPEALPTLKALKQWRETQLPLGVACDPPTVITNADYRLVDMIREMVKRDGEDALIGPVLTADTIGVGKPSPRGLELARTKSGVTSARHWIHMGDTTADRVAAERAGCHFLSCSSKRGPVWEELRQKLEEICGSISHVSSMN